MLPFLNNLRINIHGLTTTLLLGIRRDIFHGHTQEAKLYEIVSGRKHGLPTGIVDNYFPGISSMMYPAPLRAIVDYVKEYHPHNYRPKWTFEHEGVLVEVDLEGAEMTAVLRFYESAVYLVSDDITSSKMKLHGPLFHEPYSVGIDMTWLGDTYINQLVDALCDGAKPKLYGNYGVEVGFEVFYPKNDDGKFVVDNAPESVKILTGLFSSRQYGCGIYNLYYSEQFNGYKVTLSAENGNWDLNPTNGTYLKLAVSKDGSSGVWDRNPALVRDIQANALKFVDNALAAHERAIKEVE